MEHNEKMSRSDDNYARDPIQGSRIIINGRRWPSRLSRMLYLVAWLRPNSADRSSRLRAQVAIVDVAGSGPSYTAQRHSPSRRSTSVGGREVVRPDGLRESPSRHRKAAYAVIRRLPRYDNTDVEQKYYPAAASAARHGAPRFEGWLTASSTVASTARQDSRRVGAGGGWGWGGGGGKNREDQPGLTFADP